MPKHHYLPATYLARFSQDIKKRDRRKRVIFVGNMEEKKVFPSTVGNAGAVNNLYSIIDGENNSQLIDDLWSRYESELNYAIDNLIGGNIGAKMWIRILVPFVACMLVRGPDFNERMTRRLHDLGIDEDSSRLSKSTINKSRSFELQRLLGPVTVSKWIVAETEGEELLITNDLGYCKFINPSTAESGMAIPLDHDHILLIIPRNGGDILYFNNNGWVPIIYYTKLPRNNHLDLNYTMVSFAQKLIFCPNESIAEKYVSRSNYDPSPIEPSEIGFITGRNAAAHEFTWHHLAGAIENEILELDDFSLDVEKLTNHWYPYVFLATNLIEFPSAIIRRGNIISARFYDPEDYFILSNVITLSKMGSFELVLEEATKGLEATQNQELIIRFLLARSDAYLKLDQTSKSISELEKILFIDPNNLLAKARKAAIYLTEDKLDSALSLLGNVLDIDPDSGLARLYLADYYLKKKDFDHAIKETALALRCLPKSSLFGKVYLVRGIAYHGKGEIEEAINNYSLAIEHIDENESLSVCYFQRALANIEQNKSNKELNEEINEVKKSFGTFSFGNYSNNEDNLLWKAIQDLDRCVEISVPEEILIEVLALRARIRFEIGEFDASLQDFVKAEIIEEQNPKYPFFLGNILLTKGELCSAIKNFKRVLLLDQQTLGANNNIGIAYFLKGDHKKAKKHLENELSLSDKTLHASSSLRYLSQINLIKNDLEMARSWVKRAEQIDIESKHNDFINGLINLYSKDYISALNLFRRYGSVSQLVDSALLFEVFPLAYLCEESRAKKIYHENFCKVTGFTKLLFIRHLVTLTKINPKSQLLNSIREILNKN